MLKKFAAIFRRPLDIVDVFSICNRPTIKQMFDDDDDDDAGIAIPD